MADHEAAQAEGVLQALFGDVFARSTIRKNSSHLLDNIGPRLSGSAGGAAAQSFVEETLKKSGLDEVKTEPFPVLGWERGPLVIEVLSPGKKTVHAFALGLSCSTPEAGLCCDVIDAGYGAPHDFTECKGEVKGKFVLAEDGGPEGKRACHRSVKLSAAARAGAAGFLLMSRENGDLPKTGTCAFSKLSSIPGVGISREHGMGMRRMLNSGRVVSVRMAMKNRVFDAKAANVIGILRGREIPGEYVYFGGHLDSWDISDGAMDNGSGVLVALEAARALAGLPERPRRSIAACFFMGEETGLCGSMHHVRSNKAVLDNIISYMNLDIVSEPVQLIAGGSRACFPLLDRVTDILAPIGIDNKIGISLGLHSDHLNFLLEGVPTLSWKCSFRDESTRFCHSSADTPEKNDTRGLLSCACATAALVHAQAEVAGRPAFRIPPGEVREMLEHAGLRQELEMEQAWPF